MKTLAQVVLSTLAFVLLFVITLVLTGATDSESNLGSVLRAAAGVFLAALTVGWIRYLVGVIRAARVG